MDKDLETRTSTDFELRAEGDLGRKVVGHAAVFNSVADIGGFFREQIAPGAFYRVIAEKHDVRALIDHEPAKVLGRTKAGTLRLAEDAEGLAVDFDLPDTQAARDLAVSMERGDINQMSIGFRVLDADWDHTQDPALRTVKDVELFDVSVVTFPAYEQAGAALRSMEGIKKRYNTAPLRAKMKLGLINHRA